MPIVSHVFGQGGANQGGANAGVNQQSGIVGNNEGVTHKPYVNPNPWDGIGPDTNKIAQSNANQTNNNGGMIAPGTNEFNQTMGNLSPQQQQILQMFMNNGGGGFQGFSPVQGNPFQPTGANINNWGATPNNGIYGGT
jgi:hypothetical protein